MQILKTIIEKVEKWLDEEYVSLKLGIFIKLSVLYIFYLSVFTLIFKVLKQLALKENFCISIDIIPKITYGHILVIQTIFMFIGTLMYLFREDMYTKIFISINKYEYLIKSLVIIEFIIALLKGFNYKIIVWVGGILSISFTLYDYFGTCDIEQVPMPLRDKLEERDIYSDLPIYNKKLLSTHLQKQVDELETIISNYPTKIPFTLLLQGEWGSGKTSVLYSLEQELLKNKKYFILKIDTLLFNSVEDIVEYIRGYFKALFFRYNIEVIYQDSIDDYLNQILDCLGDKSVAFNPFISYISKKKTLFKDIHNRRKQFQSNIIKLLEISKRKSIIFLLDDTDRINNDEGIILKIIKEIFNIDGIFNIILRKECREKEEGELDKFINLRIYMNNNMETIESDNQINELLKVGMERYINSIKDKDLLSFNCNDEFSVQYFNRINMSTGRINNLGKNDAAVSGRVLFYDVFLLDLYYNSEKLGIKLEEIIMSYFSNQEEIKKINTETGVDAKTKGVIAQNLMYFGKKIDDLNREFSWINKLQQFTEEFIMFINILISTINDGKTEGCKQLLDLINNYFGRELMLTNNGKIIHNIQFEYIYDVMFSESEKDEINNLIKSENYENIKLLLEYKLDTLYIRKSEILFLNKFLIEIRNKANIPRRLKFIIRESNLYGENLLSYIINNIDITTELDELSERYKIRKKITFNSFNFTYFMQKPFYYHYVYKYIEDRAGKSGKRFMVLEFIESKYYLVYYEISNDNSTNKVDVFIRIISIDKLSKLNMNKEIAEELLKKIIKFNEFASFNNIQVINLDGNDKYIFENVKKSL